MADHVLRHGLRDATLRPLARAAGTSDRMLIYRYGSKERLVSALLGHLADRLTGLLDIAAVGPGPTPDALARALIDLLRAPDARPYVGLWLEVVAGAARGDETYRAAAARILTHFHGWLIPRVPAGDADPAAAAARILVFIEGSLVIETAGPAGADITRAASCGA